MRIHAQKQNQPQQQASTNIIRSNAERLTASPIAHSIMHLQRSIGNQAVQRVLQAYAGGLEVNSDTSPSTHSGHDFNRIPLHTSVSKMAQSSRVGDSRENDYEQPPNRIDEYASGKGDVKVNGEIGTKSAEARGDEALEASLSTDTPPKLTMKTVSGPTDGMCGRFRWIIQWVLDKVSPKGGLVVQKLNSKYDVKDCDGKPVIAPKEVYDPSWFPYWEAWEIKPGQKVTKYAELGDDSDDTYLRSSSNLTTKGNFSYTGSADFYEGAQLSKTNLKALHKPPAGDLPMAKTKPVLPAGSGAIAHNLKATWDCCSKDKSATQSSNLDTT